MHVAREAAANALILRGKFKQNPHTRSNGFGEFDYSDFISPHETHEFRVTRFSSVPIAAEQDLTHA